MIATTLRFDRLAHGLIQEEADQAGMPFAQFVREAALIRASIRAASRDYPELDLEDSRLARLFHELSERCIELAKTDRNNDGS